MSRRRALMLLLTFSCIPLSITGCQGASSPVSVGWPNAISDGSGGAITVYQVLEGDGLATYAQRVGPRGDLLWKGKGTPLYFAKYTFAPLLSASLVDDGAGGAIAVWGQVDGPKAQRLDPEGHPLWGPDGFQLGEAPVDVVKAISDGLGGAILAWGGVHLVKISSEARPSWPVVTVPSVYGWGPHGLFDIVGDELGDVLLVWEDNRHNVFAEKIGPDGDILWPVPGVQIVNGKGTGSADYAIASDGFGGAIVAWVAEERGQDGRPARLGPFVQRIGPQGEVLWQGEGVHVSPETQVQGNWVNNPILVEDGEGGAIIFWFSISPISIQSQRIDGRGNHLWGDGGITVWDGKGAPTNPFFSAVSDGNRGAIITWNDCSAAGVKREGYPLARAQRLSSDGQKLWGETGAVVAASPTGQLRQPMASGDGSGGLIVAWAAGPATHSINRSYVQRIDSDGNPQFGAEGASPDP